jgi:hypothetical protein|tara:strand:- start:1193 stop:1309 length:117 start_codon:yes stop_codon:yes gene_type:complete
MAGWLIIAGLVGGMTWMFALFMYMVLMWAKGRQEARDV